MWINIKQMKTVISIHLQQKFQISCDLVQKHQLVHGLFKSAKKMHCLQLQLRQDTIILFCRPVFWQDVGYNCKFHTSGEDQDNCGDADDENGIMI